jgi:hypothetical protein
MALPFRRAWRVTKWLLAAWLVICLIGEVWKRTHPRQFTALAPPPGEPVVQLRAAPLPSVLRFVAIHYWLLAFDPDTGRWHRWEVWQSANAGGTSWGHVHKDFLHPDEDVGGGPYCVLEEWRGQQARAILTVLDRSPSYPYRDQYCPIPGPYSNTYAAWVLREARVPVDLHPMAVGKDYYGLCGAGMSPIRTGVQAEIPLVGLKLGVLDGLEVLCLGLTFGLDSWPPAVKLPFGRLGFAE